MRCRKIMLFLLCVALSLCCIRPIAAQAENEYKVVRVGWFESPFNYTNISGKRTGYAYEYQQKVADHTGWKYEYVEGSFPELIEKLKNGEIDLMSDVSYTEDRAKEMLFSSVQMGAEAYYLFVSAKNNNIKSGDTASLNGKKIGVNKDSYQELLFKEWTKKYNVEAEIVELMTSQDESIQMMKDGKIDAFITINVYIENNIYIPAFKIGQSEFFFAVNKNRADLLKELDMAMAKIQDENFSYNQQLYDKYVRSEGINAYLPVEETEWLAHHGTVRVGYLKDYMPFCASDPQTGELIGALKEYLEQAANCMNNVNIKFSTAAYGTTLEAIEALKAGEIDCVFPVNLSSYDGEQIDVSVTTPIIESEMSAVVRKNIALKNIFDVEPVIAVDAGNLNYEMFVNENYPQIEVQSFNSVEECFRAVAGGKADFTPLNNYCIALTESLRDNYDLVPLPIGKTISFSFALRKTDGELYYILNKVSSLVPSSSIQSSMLLWSFPDESFSLLRFLKKNLVAVILIILIIALLIVFLLIHRANRMQHRLEEREKLQNALSSALVEAQAANKAKTAFLNNMSHDIRTPMNAIVGFTALAASHIDKKEQVQEYLKKISISSQHLLSLINDVLDMSRIESGKVSIEASDVHLPLIIHDLQTIINSNVTAKQLELSIDTQDVKHEDIITDKLRLNQILLNILSNAIKYTPPGGKISFRVIEKPSHVEGVAEFEFRIKDNGIGMSEEFQKTIFEAFSREKNSTVSGIQGTGLGMAITKNIVDMMGGVITMHSEEGKGSEFIVNLPFKINGNPTLIEPVPEIKGCRALVADDDTDTCLSVCTMLREIGMRPDWTNYGKEAVIRTKDAMESKDAFGVYIIDWMMPDMNGIEVVRRIRKVIGDDVPIIIMTAYDWTDIEEEAKEAGVTAFCNKPLFMSDLRNTLAEMFRKNEVIAEEQQKKIDFTGKKILFVEDNELNQMIAVAILKKVGFAVDIAANGQIAVNMMNDSPAGTYDVIMMDIQMPIMDGYEATRRIRAFDDKDKANIPIVAVTANAFEEDRKLALDAGMNGHLAKPYDIPAMMETLSKLIDK